MQQHNSEDVQLFDALEMGHFLIIEIWLIDDVELLIRIMFKLLNSGRKNSAKMNFYILRRYLFHKLFFLIDLIDWLNYSL